VNIQKKIFLTLYFSSLVILIWGVVVPPLLSGDTNSVLLGLAAIFLTLGAGILGFAQLFFKK
jgi:hypothetical protein